MDSDFSRSLSLLRKEKGISQRSAAKELGISQALLSHYENGIREPGLAFVVRACDFYGVSADFLLGRTLSRDGTTILDADTLYDYSKEKDNILRGSVMATLSKKLLVNSIVVLFDLLGKVGSKAAIRSASDYLSTAIYKLYRHLYRADGTLNEDFFSVSTSHFLGGIPTVEMVINEVEYTNALNQQTKEKNPFPPMSNDALMAAYPGTYQSLLQIIHSTGERIKRHIDARREEGRLL
ncbi:MAG: helix-turn-helix transcriptional regulator [Intestinimonas sp.]|jgi:transcriptional regulator with XRE-family HTH domain|nr:helix-turn-helix transcriptional regulator [Intestinimonas sp.]